jgi:hypothetical protein
MSFRTLTSDNLSTNVITFVTPPAVISSSAGLTVSILCYDVLSLEFFPVAGSLVELSSPAMSWVVTWQPDISFYPSPTGGARTFAVFARILNGASVVWESPVETVELRPGFGLNDIATAVLATTHPTLPDNGPRSLNDTIVLLRAVMAGQLTRSNVPGLGSTLDFSIPLPSPAANPQPPVVQLLEQPNNQFQLAAFTILGW